MEYMRWCRGAWDGTSEEASDALRCDPSSSLSQASLKATNPKSCRLDVYGQPRGEMPRMFRQDEAEASLSVVLGTCYHNHDDDNAGYVGLQALDEINYHIRHLHKVMCHSAGEAVARAA